MDINGEPRAWKHVPTRTQARTARLDRGWEKQFDPREDGMKPESHRREYARGHENEERN